MRLIDEKILCIAVAMVIIFEEELAQKIRFILQNSMEVEYNSEKAIFIEDKNLSVDNLF